MASTYLTRTVTSAGNRKTWTFSAWVKRCTTSDNAAGYDSIFSTNISNEGINIAFGNGSFTADGDYFEVTHAAASGGGTTDWSVRTNPLLRDPSGWYHLVVAFDTTQSTTADRVKLYVNGSEVDKTVTTGPALNTDYEVNNTQQHTIGRWQRDGNSYFDGYLAHFHFIDGTAYDASAFGQTDSTTGIWKPKLAPSVTYGTNGFFLKMENSGAMGTDSSGNGNTWSVGGGTLTQTQDTPSNVFATMNILNSVGTLTQGNLTYATGTADSRSGVVSLGVSSGKWYFEVKDSSSNGNEFVSVVGDGFNALISSSRTYSYNDGVSYSASNGNKWIDGTSTSYGATYTTNDIIGVALNLDDDEITFYKNGTSQGTRTSKTFDNNTNYFLAFGNGSSGSSPTVQLNFGNGYFGTTAVSSGNADDAGIGIFEYAPPTGYYALCTKNIASYG
jgi:hypothetical protein